MGLFDFAKDFSAGIGAKVFGVGDADASEQIYQHLVDNNLGIFDFKVSMENEEVCVEGRCTSAAAKEKVILAEGNMKGVSSVNADAVTIPDEELAAAEAANVEYYTIVSGDTLWGISSKFLGNGSKYMEIFEANKEVILDPDKIFVGQKIRIPKD